MQQIPYIPFYIQDILGSPDVQMMSLEEVGAYFLLLFYLYQNGGKLENDEEGLQRLCRGIKIPEKVRKKFYIENGFLRHKRADDEIEKYNKKSKTQKEKADKRWKEAKKKPNATAMPRHKPGIAGAMPQECQSESESYKEKINKKEKIEKHKFNEFVLLTSDEFSKLKEKFGEAQTQELIDRLNNYIGSKGAQYKSHYHTILNWSQKDIQVRAPTNPFASMPKLQNLKINE